MSEKLQHHEGHHEKLDLSEELKRNLERLHDTPEAEKSPEDVARLAHKAAEHAVSGHETTVGEDEAAPSQQYHFGQYKLLRKDAYAQSLKRIRSHLNAPERAFSKVVHQPVVDKTSEGLAKTVARPSGLLGAGLVAFLGSSILIYMAKHYGFRYNFTTFFLLLTVGFAAGIIFELSVRLLKKFRR